MPGLERAKTSPGRGVGRGAARADVSAWMDCAGSLFPHRQSYGQRERRGLQAAQINAVIREDSDPRFGTQTPEFISPEPPPSYQNAIKYTQSEVLLQRFSDECSGLRYN